MEQQNLFETPVFKIDKPIRLIELFAGIGAQAKALQNIGADFERYRVVEIEPLVVKTYNAVHGTDFVPLDITKISGDDLGVRDRERYCYIMTYSFPCQDLSVAGNQKGMEKGAGTRSGLLWEVERLLNELGDNLPQVLLMENVPQVHGTKNIGDFTKWIHYLYEKGYSSFYKDLSATDFGIPQSRTRCFMVSILGNWEYHFPEPQPLKTKMSDLLEEDVPEKFFINSRESSLLLNKLREKIMNIPCKYKKADGNEWLDKEDASLFDVGNETASTLMARDWKWYRSSRHNLVIVSNVRQVGNIKVSENNSWDNPQRGRVYDPDAVSPTLTTASGGNLVPYVLAMNNTRIRKLTPREFWRLMGFTDEDFDKAKEVTSKSKLYFEAGNSIVVPVLEAIFKQMIKEDE